MVKGVGCMGLCSAGPLVEVQSCGQDEKILYQYVRESDAAEVAQSLGTGPVERLRCPTDLPFFARQQRIVLENSGVIDPEQIDDYIAAGGYRGLVEAVTERTPGDVLIEVNASGLRGRGGGGYPVRLEVVDGGQDAGRPALRDLQRR